jgi:hypothetical protein
MGQFWTKRKEDHSKEEETMQSDDFLTRWMKLQKEPAKGEEPKIENSK